MKTALRNMGTIITGNTPSKGNEDYWNSSDICFVKPDIIADSGITVITETIEHISEAARSKARIVGEDTIFVTCIGSIGKIAIASTNEYAFNQQINAIVPYENINSRYLAYALLYAKPRLTAIANAPVVPIISKSQFGEFELEIEESIDKQVAIVDLLDKISGIIDARQKQIHTLDILIKARFVEMFGDPVSNPKGWTIKPLLDMGDCKNGMNFHYNDSGVELHCLGVGDFQDHSIIDDTSMLSMVSLNEFPSEEYILRDDDIVFVRSNGNKALVGRCVAVYPGNVPTTFSGFCIRYRKKNEEISIPYLLRVLKTDTIRAKMAGRGANIQNLNQQILGALTIPVPPMELQKQFTAFVSQVDKSKVAVQKALDKAQLLFDSLMQQYFG